MTIFEFRYNNNIYLSSMETISIHRTSRGATKAMRKYVANEKEKWGKLHSNKKERKIYPFKGKRAWNVIETEILE